LQQSGVVGNEDVADEHADRKMSSSNLSSQSETDTSADKSETMSEVEGKTGLETADHGLKPVKSTPNLEGWYLFEFL